MRKVNKTLIRKPEERRSFGISGWIVKANFKRNIFMPLRVVFATVSLGLSYVKNSLFADYPNN